MNCQKGDMAIVIRSRTGSLVGQVFTCIRILDQPYPGQNWEEWMLKVGPIWVIDRTVPWFYEDGSPWHIPNLPWMPDRHLMPINPLNDESVEESCETQA
jgi:hypothetical protein